MRARKIKGTKRRMPRRGKNQFGLQTRVPKAFAPGILVPPEFDVRMSYPLTFLITNAVGALVSRRFTPNGLYDLDPTLGSTAIPGFTEYAAFYFYYRVIGYQVTVEYANSEAFPVSVYFVHVNTDPGATGTNYQVLAMNPYGKVDLLAAEGGVSRGRYVSPRIPISKIAGTPAIEYEDNYRGSTTTNPTDLTYFGIGIESVNGNLTANNGVTFMMRLTLDVRWYDRKSLTA